MANRYRTTDGVINGLCFSMAKDGTYSPKTIAHMREHCQIVKRYLEGMTPYDITAEDLKDMALTMQSEGLAVSTQKDYVHAIKSLMKFVRNPAWTTRILFQADTRPHVDWLTPDQAQRILDDKDVSPKQHLIIVLALCMGLRRVELVRLRIQDICCDRAYITVTGKGHAGGKLRLVPFHPRFIPALQDYCKYRGATARQGKNDAPNNLLIWYSRQDHRTHEYNAIKGSGIDGLIRQASRITGVKFSAHTLRRTFGRMMWLSGVPVVTIAKILGHSSTEQTLQYIGANLDDMAEAMRTLSLQ